MKELTDAQFLIVLDRVISQINHQTPFKAHREPDGKGTWKTITDCPRSVLLALIKAESVLMRMELDRKPAGLPS